MHPDRMTNTGFGRPMFWMALFVSSVGCGPGELGEACDDPGSAEACVDGAICTNESDEEASCLEICADQADCSGGYSCNGVSGTSIKSCQPDDVAGDKKK
jgi:hypothetical protein